MPFLQGLHGVVALALLLGLLLAEEAGVPLPFAPGELTLIVAGLLIAAGGLNPYLFLPLAVVACVAGSMLGFSWAQLAGERALEAVARRLHQQRNLTRVSDRVRSAGWAGIAVTRLIPGLRIYTTLAAGALRVPRRVFLTGMVPVTIVWVAVFVILGALVGLPVEHFFNRLEQLAVQGAILIAMGVGVYVAVRRTPPSSGAGLVRLPRALRVAIAVVIDVAVVASVVTGLLALGRRLFGLGVAISWLDGVVALVAVAVFYIVIARRGAGATVGEALLETSYAHERHLTLRPRTAWHSLLTMLGTTEEALRPTAAAFRALGDPERLRLVRALLDQPGSVDELASRIGTQPFEVRHELDRLRGAGLLETAGEDPATTYAIRSELAASLVELVAALQEPELERQRDPSGPAVELPSGAATPNPGRG